MQKVLKSSARPDQKNPRKLSLGKFHWSEPLDIQHAIVLLLCRHRLRQLREYLAQRPLNPLDRLDDPYFVFFSFAAVERDHLKRIANVVIHLSDNAQSALNMLLPLPLSRRQRVDQRCGNEADQHAGEHDQIAAGNALTMETNLKQITADRNHDQRDETLDEISYTHRYSRRRQEMD